MRIFHEHKPKRNKISVCILGSPPYNAIRSSKAIEFTPVFAVSNVCVCAIGWVETTYLDEDFRVGRGDKGSVFVTARQGKQSSSAPTPAAAGAQR